jgi:hypothetical protein
VIGGPSSIDIGRSRPHLLGDGVGDCSGDAALHADYLGTGRVIDMRYVDTVARYLFYIFVIDFSLEMLDLINRITRRTSPSAAWISSSTARCTSRISWCRSRWERFPDRITDSHPGREIFRRGPQA